MYHIMKQRRVFRISGHEARTKKKTVVGQLLNPRSSIGINIAQLPLYVASPERHGLSKKMLRIELKRYIQRYRGITGLPSSFDFIN